jgi:hypothetical protein
LGKIDHHIGAFGRPQQQGVLLHIADDDILDVVLVVDRLIADDDGLRQETAISPDLHHGRTAAGWIKDTRWPAIKADTALLRGVPVQRERCSLILAGIPGEHPDLGTFRRRPFRLAGIDRCPGTAIA